MFDGQTRGKAATSLGMAQHTASSTAKMAHSGGREPVHLSVVGSLRLHTAAEQQLTRLPLPSRSDEACKLAIFGCRRDQSLKSRWFRGRYASASIDAKIGASTSSLNREAFGGQLRSNVFSDADDGRDNVGFVRDDEA